MLKAPSLTKEHTLVYSGDPAIVQRPAELADDASDEEKKAHAEAVERYESDIRVARDTGDWTKLILEGQRPTLWHVRPLHGSLWDWFIGEANRRDLKQIEIAAFLIRVALVKVENLGPFKLEHKKHDGKSLVTEDSLDAIYSIGYGSADTEGLGRRIVAELGAYLFARGQLGLRPL